MKKSKREPRYALDYIEYKDHSSSSVWYKVDQLKTDSMMIKSIGWVVKEDKNEVIIGSTVEMPGQGCPAESTTRQYIVKSCITKRIRLREPGS